LADPGPDWSPGPVLWCGIPKILENGKDEDMIAIAVTDMGGGEDLGRLGGKVPEYRREWQECFGLERGAP
jgi:hypothetical protein